MSPDHLRFQWRRWPGETRLQAFQDQELVGFVSLRPWRKRVQIVWVVEHRRRQGIATALYDHLAQRHPGFRHGYERTPEGSAFLSTWQHGSSVS